MKATNNNQQSATNNNIVATTPKLVSNINEMLELHDIEVVDAEILNPRNLLDEYDAFFKGTLKGVNFIQICILNAINKAEEGLILNTPAMEQLEIAYQLADNTNVPRKKA